MNAKEQLDFVRDILNEATAAHWTDVGLVRRLNIAQRKVALRVGMSSGHWLTKSVSVTPVASVITLPSDCGKPLYMEEVTSGRPVRWLESVSYRRVSRTIGTTLDLAGTKEAYPLLGTIEVNEDSYVEPCTLWYQIRVPDLHTGTAVAAGTGAGALEFAADANRKFVADYYVGVVVEQYDAGGAYVEFRSTITAYTAAGVATVTGTPVDSQIYATISRLPLETHELIAYMAAVDAISKGGSVASEQTVMNLRTEMNEVAKGVYNWLDSRVPEQSGVMIGDVY